MTAFQLGYDDGYANRPAKSQSPDYRNGYAIGQEEQLHEQHYWDDEAILASWESK